MPLKTKRASPKTALTLGFKTMIWRCPHGALGPQNGSGLQQIAYATQLAIKYLYQTAQPPSTLPLTTKQRNTLIREQYEAGETLQALAQRFDISHQRVHQIIHNRRK